MKALTTIISTLYAPQKHLSLIDAFGMHQKNTRGKIFRGRYKNFRWTKKPEWVKKFLWRGKN